MKPQIIFACLLLFLLQTTVGGFVLQTAGMREKGGAFSFAGVKYLHRYTKDNQHEYTPNGQEDLKTWTDMVTILLYPKANDGEALAATANAVLEN